MAKYIKGNAVANATSYELFELANGIYTSLKTASAINFDLSALSLAAGDHVLVVKAHASGYESSEYSNEVTYTVTSSGEDTGGDNGSGETTTLEFNDANGYMAIADGSETASASWIHSDLIDINKLSNNDSGVCTSNLQGHAKVACVSYYSSNDVSSYISGLQLETSTLKQYTAEEIKNASPEGATYVAFSTHAANKPLQITVTQ